MWGISRPGTHKVVCHMQRVEELEALMDGFSTVLSGKNDSAERDESYADAGRNGTASRGFKHGQSIPAKELGNCDDDRLHAESDGSGTIQADEVTTHCSGIHHITPSTSVLLADLLFLLSWSLKAIHRC